MKKVSLVALLLISAFLLSCVSTRKISYESTARSPKPKDFVIEIYERENINHPYKVIGIVEANAGRKHSVNDTLEDLKEQARDMGGDALMDLQHGAGAGVITGSGNIYAYGTVRENWSAKVIVWGKN